MKRFLHIALVFILVQNTFGQDIHFTQLSRAEYQLNPAYLGAFNGNLRATFNWKDQWRSINKSFRTFGSCVELSFGKGNARRPTSFAVGLSMFKDVSGDVELGNSNVALAFSTFVKVNRNSRFIAGLQAGYGSTGINPTTMQWGNQYGGNNFDPSLFNGESIDWQPFNYVDLGMGIAYWYTKNDRNVVHSAPSDAKIGLSVYHINKPQFTYGNNSALDLPMRFVLNGSALFATNTSNIFWYPNMNVMFQRKQHELLIGSLWKVVLQTGSKSTGFGGEVSLTGGASLRVTNVIDAFSPQLFVNAYNVSVGLSYDINVSRLSMASNYRGGFEFSLRFTNPDSYTHRNPMRRAVSI